MISSGKHPWIVKGTVPDEDPPEKPWEKSLKVRTVFRIPLIGIYLLAYTGQSRKPSEIDARRGRLGFTNGS